MWAVKTVIMCPVVCVLPEFLLRQVELHVFIFLVLFIQPPQRCICRLVAGLLHKRVDVLLKNPAEEKTKSEPRH